MSLQSDEAESQPGVAQLTSAPLLESVTKVFSHLDDVIEHATTAQRHSRHVGDAKAFDALDDALSLLQHVRSRLHYDLPSGTDPDLGPAVSPTIARDAT
jgi:hypothetical protein